MAAQQQYHAYAQHSKGTLMPGQTISVNKYTVQVERYLSQGGFAQVYLVRTQAPVYNTTHHVLKHVVVANESMLTEVKKEVDVMRLLRGHPNVVYLIDAAWAKMPNGAFEIYILMEYCSGGGIIDMMNRRLRERLTEAEILQIFVDVCEGVAHMHNSRPPLLHRDLKVENILQSSLTSFKLCDFGSTAMISKSPTNSREMRVLEADLNRHTTLQYRAPEMIDLHSRRPIDEKSDVWALGVLLYKLCYYTTPFEEHGPLAILNVQYRFPSYPVYSQQLMHLISSMLREHGAQRPTIFEVLAHVHSFRGTKSPYTYPLPTPTPLSPRRSDFKSNPLDGVITYRQAAQSDTTIQPVPRVQSVKPAELTTPQERRGRPKPSARDSATPSPSVPPKPPMHQHGVEKKLIDDSDFGHDGKAAWSSATAKNAPMVGRSDSANDGAWNLHLTPGLEKAAKSSSLPPHTGFNDDFAQALWASASSSGTKPLLPTPSPRPQATYSPKIGPLPHATITLNGEIHKVKDDLQVRTTKERDAFEGLGLMTPVSKPNPTLGEARKLRTGLAIMSTNINRPIKPSPSPRLRPKAHTPRVSPIPPPRPLESETSAWASSRPAINRAGSSAETRFPSLEELDAAFLPSSSSSGTQENKPSHHTPEPPTLPPRPSKIGSIESGLGSGARTGPLKPVVLGYVSEGTRSAQVTGMRDTKGDFRRTQNEDSPALGSRERGKLDNYRPSTPSKADLLSQLRPLAAKGNQNTLTTSVPAGDTSDSPPSIPVSVINHASRSTDLLTGDDESELTSRRLFESKLGQDMFKIRESPSKRASVIERGDVIEATIPQQGHALTPPAKTSPVVASRVTAVATAESPTVTRFVKAFPVIDTAVASKHHFGLTENWSPVASRTPHEVGEKERASESSSEDEGPEDATPLSSLSSKAVDSQVKRKGRQSSVHDLVDLWGGSVPGAKAVQPELVAAPAPFKQNINAAKLKSVHIPPRASSPSRGTPLVQNYAPVGSKNEQPSQPSSGAPPSPSLKSGRARPQSMFVFPSKTTDRPPQPPATLVPPEDPKPRSGRRTSISDMVQHYEAIQASARAGNSALPSPTSLSKPPSRDHPQDPASTGPTRPSLDKIAVALPGLGAPSARIGDPSKRRTSLTAPPQTLFNPQRTSPNFPPALKSTEKPESDAGMEIATSRTRNTSVVRPEKGEHSVVTTRKPVLTMDDTTKQPQSDPPAPTPNASIDRSPSPERPFQGVGKLIDQWQRKSAEAEASRNAILTKRANITPSKRTPLAPSSNKGS